MSSVIPENLNSEDRFSRNKLLKSMEEVSATSTKVLEPKKVIRKKKGLLERMRRLVKESEEKTAKSDAYISDGKTNEKKTVETREESNQDTNRIVELQGRQDIQKVFEEMKNGETREIADNMSSEDIFKASYDEDIKRFEKDVEDMVQYISEPFMKSFELTSSFINKSTDIKPESLGSICGGIDVTNLKGRENPTIDNICAAIETGIKTEKARIREDVTGDILCTSYEELNDPMETKEIIKDGMEAGCSKAILAEGIEVICSRIKKWPSEIQQQIEDKKILNHFDCCNMDCVNLDNDILVQPSNDGEVEIAIRRSVFDEDYNEDGMIDDGIVAEDNEDSTMVENKVDGDCIVDENNESNCSSMKNKDILETVSPDSENETSEIVEKCADKLELPEIESVKVSDSTTNNEGFD